MKLFPVFLLCGSLAFGQAFATSVSFAPANSSLGIVADPFGDGPRTNRVMNSGVYDGATHTSASLGIADGDVTGWSDGLDDIPANGPGSDDGSDLAGIWAAIEFSVRVGSQGLSGTPLHDQYVASGFTPTAWTFWVGIEDGVVSAMDISADAGGLPEHCAIDALSTIMKATTFPVYFTLDAAAVNYLKTNCGLSSTANTACIFVKPSANGAITIKFTANQLGLSTTDRLDDFAYDAAQNLVAYTVHAGSTLLSNTSYSASTILVVSPMANASFSIWATPLQLGLQWTDDLSALQLLDPPAIDASKGSAHNAGGTQWAKSTMLVDSQNGGRFRHVNVGTRDNITVSLKPPVSSVAVVLLRFSIPSTSEDGVYGGIPLVFNPYAPQVLILGSTLPPPSGHSYISLPTIPAAPTGYTFSLGATNDPVVFTLQSIYYGDFTPFGGTTEWRSSNAIVVHAADVTP